MKQDRKVSKAMWASIVALVLFSLKTWTDLDVTQFDMLFELLFAAAIAFGIVNDPTNKDGL